LPKRRKRTLPVTGLGWKVESGYLRVSKAIVDDFMIKKLIFKSLNFELRVRFGCSILRCFYKKVNIIDTIWLK